MSPPFPSGVTVSSRLRIVLSFTLYVRLHLSGRPRGRREAGLSPTWRAEGGQGCGSLCFTEGPLVRAFRSAGRTPWDPPHSTWVLIQGPRRWRRWTSGALGPGRRRRMGGVQAPRAPFRPLLPCGRGERSDPSVRESTLALVSVRNLSG